MDNFESQIKELEFRIAEVKKRFPYHSVQPYLIQELEELEDQSDELMKSSLNNHKPGGQTSPLRP